MSAAAVTMLPAEFAAAAKTISSGILVGSRKRSTVHASVAAVRHAASRVPASMTSTNQANSVPGGAAGAACASRIAVSRMTMSAPAGKSGG